MKSDENKVTSREVGTEKALEMTEKLGNFAGLTGKEQLRLRLLAEELMGLLRGIAGEVEAIYWVEVREKAFALHLKSQISMNQELRSELLAASSSGKNAAATGFMGKIRELFSVALMPSSEDPFMLTGLSLGLMSSGSPVGYNVAMDSYVWSMNQYKTEVEGIAEENTAAAEAWDELEKSIVANLADEVSVAIVDNDVEITIYKAF